jgi:DNA-binding transcriptional regulator YiaG
MATNDSVPDSDSGNKKTTQKSDGIFPSDDIRGMVMEFSQTLLEQYCEGKQERDELFEVAEKIAISCDPSVESVQTPEINFEFISGMIGLGIFGYEEYRHILREFWALICYYGDQLKQARKVSGEDISLYVELVHSFVYEFALYKEKQNNIVTGNLCEHVKKLNGIIDRLEEKLQESSELKPYLNEMKKAMREMSRLAQEAKRDIGEIKESSSRNLEVTESMYAKMEAGREQESRKKHLPITIDEAAARYGVSPKTINKWEKQPENRPRYYGGRDLSREAFALLVNAHRLNQAEIDQKMSRNRQINFERSILSKSPEELDPLASEEPGFRNFDQTTETE